MISFIFEHLKRFSDDFETTKALQVGVPITQDFLKDLKQLKKYYIDLESLYKDDEVMIQFMDALQKGEHPSEYPPMFAQFYQLFSHMLAKQYDQLKIAHQRRLSIIAQNLSGITHVNEYDFYFHGVEGNSLYSEDEIIKLHILSNTLIVAYTKEEQLKIWNLKKSTHAVLFTDQVLEFRPIEARPNHILLRKTNNQVQIVDCETETIVSDVHIDRSLDPYDIFPDGKRLACLNDVEQLEIWDFELGELIDTFPHIRNMDIIDDIRIAVTPFNSNLIKIFNLRTRTFIQELKDTKNAMFLIMLQNERLMAVYEDEIKVWNLTTKTVDVSFDSINSQATKMLDNRVAIYSDHILRVINLNTGIIEMQRLVQRNRLLMDVLPNNDLITLIDSKDIFILSLYDVRQVLSSEDYIYSMHAFPNGNVLLHFHDKLKFFG